MEPEWENKPPGRKYNHNWKAGRLATFAAIDAIKAVGGNPTENEPREQIAVNLYPAMCKALRDAER